MTRPGLVWYCYEKRGKGPSVLYMSRGDNMERKKEDFLFGSVENIGKELSHGNVQFSYIIYIRRSELTNVFRPRVVGSLFG